jgi:uncharacterized protein YwgA
VERRDLALAVMSDLAGNADEEYPLDRIRMQKAVFLLVQRGSPEWATLYRYVPYDWGPYSSQLAADIRTMENDGLLEVERGGASRYGRYRSTPKGAVAAAAIWEHLSQPEREFIRLVRAYVTQKSFTQLLREVYAAYPDFATASRFTG